MLHWQRRALPKKYSFLGKLFFLSCLGHISVLCFVLYMHQGDVLTHIDLSRVSATIMYVPFYKTIAGARELVQVQNSGGGTMQVVRASTSELPASGNQGQQSQIASGNARSKPQTRMATIKESKPKKVSRKKKQRVKKKKNKKQKSTKKVEQEPTQQEKIETSPQIEQQQAAAVAEANQAQSIDLSQITHDGPVIFAGQYDLDIMELNNDIHTEIEHVWHPPVGLSSGKYCKVRVVVNGQGGVETFEMVEPSNVLAFDMSVRHAVMAMKFPRAAYSKELVIPFT